MIHMTMMVPSSVGDAVDRLSILRIKAERISDEAKRRHVLEEIEALSKVLEPFADPMVHFLYVKLKRVNETLWDVEDRLRAMEKAGDFGADFVQQARLVYATNDRRAELKREINGLTGSVLVEVKSYVGPLHEPR